MKKNCFTLRETYPKRKHLYIIVKVIAIAFVFLLFFNGCSSNHMPAPVVSLSTKVASPQNLTEISGDSYTVQAGDTLFAIAFYSGNDYRDLAKINNLQAPYIINVNQRLRLVPARSSAPIQQAINVSTPSPQAEKIVVDPTKEQAYGVVSNNNHRKNRQLNSNSSNNTDYKLAWSWPAEGRLKIATVGSDGSKRGLDIKGSLGADIVAAAGGKVVYAGNALKGYGNLVIIKHNNDYLSAYAHNQSILVSEQMFVKQGQLIATMGNSGASEVMLHFEIRKKGKSVDPFVYLPKQ